MTRAFAVIACAAVLTAQAQTPPPPPPPQPSPLATAAAAAAAARRGNVPSGTASAAPITLTFAWPAGLSATVEAEASKTVVMDGKRRETTGGLRYRMRVAPHAEGRLISYDSFEPIGAVLKTGEAAAVEQYLTSLMPSIVVSPEGEFIRIGDIENIRQAMVQFIDAIKEKAPGAPAPPNLMKLLEDMTSEQVLTQLAAAEWQSFIGAFIGFTGKVGDKTEFDSEEPSPIMAGLNIPMRTTFALLRRTACEPGRAPDSCVVMQVKSVVAPGAMQAVMKRLLEGVKDMQGLTYDRFDSTTEVLTTLEPATMKPYSIAHTRHVDFAMSMKGQGSAAGSQTQRKNYRIRYAK